MFDPFDDTDPTLRVYEFIPLAQPTLRELLTPAEYALVGADTSTPYAVLLPDDGTDVTTGAPSKPDPYDPDRDQTKQ